MITQENIFLIGLMGAGKTTIGKQLAKQLEKTFIDADHEIEKKTGVKISVIFDLEGETGFRKREASVIEELSQHTGMVMATGGGVVLSSSNRALLKQHGLVIYLRATPYDLWLRMRYDKQRPLLQNVDVRAKLEQLYLERHPLYMATADVVIDTGSQSATIVLQQIEHALLELKS